MRAVEDRSAGVRNTLSHTTLTSDLTFTTLILGLLGFTLLMMILGWITNLVRSVEDHVPRDAGRRDKHDGDRSVWPVHGMQPARTATTRSEATTCAR